MDQDGAMAARGNVVSEFLEYLLEHPYFGRQPPKSTGREEFGAEVYLHDALAARKDGHPVEDLVATVTAAVAYSIIQACNRYVAPNHQLARVIVSGGGAANPTLVNRIAKGLTDSVVRTSAEYGIPSDAREAISFAILGNETICGTPANVPSATGASGPVILGKITPA
jgi:anhydro-N-acetylmuramic acid kinase